VLLVDERELSHGLKRYATAAPKLLSSAVAVAERESVPDRLRGLARQKVGVPGP
jgi:hypothetical protein